MLEKAVKLKKRKRQAKLLKNRLMLLKSRLRLLIRKKTKDIKY